MGLCCFCCVKIHASRDERREEEEEEAEEEEENKGLNSLKQEEKKKEKKCERENDFLFDSLCAFLLFFSEPPQHSSLSLSLSPLLPTRPLLLLLHRQIPDVQPLRSKNLLTSKDDGKRRKKTHRAHLFLAFRRPVSSFILLSLLFLLASSSSS